MGWRRSSASESCARRCRCKGRFHLSPAHRRVHPPGGGEHRRRVRSVHGSHTLQDAVLRNLQTMAESTQRVSDGIKAAHPSVEWRAISGFRNVIVHNYLGIDLEQIWKIVQEDVPTLKAAVQAELNSPPTAR
ncbi:MAG TPA: HepT-like ribonuclease domain-containing protein [Longimicrobium sp.]|nr:HepT-like ribonuclease domain-containing protein [Longimicrobium sp.]